MSERLDSYSKILLATGQINYMAHSINSVKENLEVTCPLLGTVPYNLMKEHTGFLNGVIDKLSNLMEEIGDYCNGHDMVMPIDQRISGAAFDVLIHGGDEIDK